MFVPVYLGPFKMNFPGAGYRHDLFWSEDEPGVVQELGGHFRKMVLTVYRQVVSALAGPACLPGGMAGQTAQVLLVTVK